MSDYGFFADTIGPMPDPAQMDFLLPGARQNDPDTSHAAAASMLLVAGRQRHEVLTALADGPATAAELDQRLHWPWTTANRRMKELERLGLIERTGETRLTPRGRRAEVWRVR